MILAIPAVAFTMQFSVTNVVNFAFGEFITFGAFMALTADQHLHLNLWEAFIFAGVASAILSYVVGHFIYPPFFRRRPQVLYALVLTFGMSLILANVNLATWGSLPQQLSYVSYTESVLSLGPFTITPTQISFVFVA